MSLTHVSDQDIVECLQNCPEIDGPLFDVNVLDELGFSNELWANLDITMAENQSEDNIEQDKPTTLYELTSNETSTGRLVSDTAHSLAAAKTVFNELVPGIVTPPYSPPTSSSSSSSSSSSCSDPTNTTTSITTTPTTISSSASPSSAAVATTKQTSCLISSPDNTPIQVTPTLKVSTGLPTPPKQSLPSTSTSSSTQRSCAVQDLSSLYSQMALPHFNGSLQVLKSGETVCIPQKNSIQALLNQSQPSTNKGQQHVMLQKHAVKQEVPVVGQKRQHPDITATSVSSPPSATTTGCVDMCGLSKKQLRMIKNRESASISRQRKRQYVDSLEARLKEAASKNSALLQENKSLRKQVTVLERENESLRMSASRPSSPSSPLRKPALVMMIVICFSLTTFYWNRGLQISPPSLSPITALTHVKSRALLSIENDRSLSTYEQASSGFFETRQKTTGPPIGSNALVPVGAEPSSVATSALEDRIKKWWKTHLGKMKARDLPPQQIPVHSSPSSDCKCPMGNSTRSNLTYIKLINEDMINCFKLNSLLNSNEARKNSLTIPSQAYATRLPNYIDLVDDSSRLYRDFKKFIPQNLDNYYLLSFKEHILLHPPRQNSSHLPLLSVLIPAASDFTSLLQMDCEVTSTKIISHV